MYFLLGTVNLWSSLSMLIATPLSPFSNSSYYSFLVQITVVSFSFCFRSDGYFLFMSEISSTLVWINMLPVVIRASCTQVGCIPRLSPFEILVFRSLSFPSELRESNVKIYNCLHLPRCRTLRSVLMSTRFDIFVNNPRNNFA